MRIWFLKEINGLSNLELRHTVLLAFQTKAKMVEPLSAQSSEDMCTISVFAQNEYTRLHKHISFWPIEETRSNTFISVDNFVFLGSGPYNRGHVKLMDAIQVVPDMKATALPDCFSIPFQYFNENRATKQARWPNRTCSLLHTAVSVLNPENEPPHVRR